MYSLRFSLFNIQELGAHFYQRRIIPYKGDTSSINICLVILVDFLCECHVSFYSPISFIQISNLWLVRLSKYTLDFDTNIQFYKLPLQRVDTWPSQTDRIQDHNGWTQQRDLYHILWTILNCKCKQPPLEFILFVGFHPFLHHSLPHEIDNSKIWD